METENILEWFYLAGCDLDTVALLRKMRPRHYEIICYHCEQSAEKYLKGYLVSQGVLPPKTHELERLCALCEEQEPAFAELFASCAFLTSYGTQPRYPHEMEITQGDVDKAAAAVQKVHDFVPLAQLRAALLAQRGGKDLFETIPNTDIPGKVL